MRFGQPHILVYLWILVPLILFCWVMMQRKGKLVEKFAQPQLIPFLASHVNFKRYYLKLTLLILVFFFSIMALARPQWGFEWQEIKRKGIDILIAIDTSKSMLTADVKPNRLERTKLGVKDLVKKLQGDRIGLIAFAGEAFMVCPLTVDYGGFLLTLEDVNTDTVPRGGTAVAKAIEEAMRSYEQISTAHKTLIVLTDGENLEGDPLRAAQEANKKGIKIFCIGIGTQEGELIQVENERGEKGFLKDEQGNFVKSHLNEDLLQKIAVVTGGAYVRSSGAQFGLDLIYERELSKLEKREMASKKEKRYYERFQIPLAIAVFFLMVESCMTIRIRHKNILMIVGLVALFMGIQDDKVYAAPIFKDIYDGNRHYKEQEYEAALQKYQQALPKDPNSDIINFNLGTALYRLKRYPEAIEHFQKSLLTEKKDLKAKSYFNMGDVYYRVGMNQENDREIDDAISSLEIALDHVEKSLVINKDDKDAQYNRDFYKAELKRLKLQKEQFPDLYNKKKQSSQDQQTTAEKKATTQAQSQSEKDRQQSDKDTKQQEESITKLEEAQQERQASTQDNQAEQKMAAGSDEQREKLKKEDVKRFLEEYQNTEEPRGLLNLQRGQAQEQPVLKDW